MLMRAVLFLWIGFVLFGLAIGLPLGWGFSHFHHSSQPLQGQAANAPTNHAPAYVVKEPETYFEKWTDPLVIFTGLLFAVTVALAIATYGLFAETRLAARKVRSILRGAGTNGRGVFHVEASNSGEGAAVIKRIQWRFAQFGDFAAYPFERSEPSGEVIAGRERAKTVKIVPVVTDRPDPMIVFRFDYYDVNRRTTHTIDHAMRISPKDLPTVPVFIDAPPDFLADTFPVETEEE